MSGQFDFCGDHLALDFANTLSDRQTQAPVERLNMYGDLVAFAVQAGVVDEGRAASLRDRARRDPGDAERVLDEARHLREALYRLFAAVAGGADAHAADVAVLDGQLRRLHLDEQLAFTWRRDPQALDDFLGAVVLSALQLASDPLRRQRVRLCEAPDCLWLFLDTSRNRSRRWCDMRQCGNRMKARRHYARGRVQQ